VHGLAGELELDGRRVAFTHGHEPATGAFDWIEVPA
jgi:hypothetical protein